MASVSVRDYRSMSVPLGLATCWNYQYVAYRTRFEHVMESWNLQWFSGDVWGRTGRETSWAGISLEPLNGFMCFSPLKKCQINEFISFQNSINKQVVVDVGCLPGNLQQGEFSLKRSMSRINILPIYTLTTNLSCGARKSTYLRYYNHKHI